MGHLNRLEGLSRMSRRQFIGSVTAATVGMVTEAWSMAQDVAPRTRRPIDVHHHLLSPQMLAKRRASGAVDRRLDDWTPAQSIELMDRNGVRASVVSVSTPGIWFGNADEAAHWRAPRTSLPRA